MPKHLESILIAEVKLAFGALPDLYLYRTNTGSAWSRRGTRMVQFSTPGCGDFTGVMRGGRAVYIECKAPGETQEPDQITFQRAVEQQGGLYILAYSVDDVRTALTSAGIQSSSLTSS